MEKDEKKRDKKREKKDEELLTTERTKKCGREDVFCIDWLFGGRSPVI